LVKNYLLSLALNYCRSQATAQYQNRLHFDEIDVLFLPYESSDCILLHSFFARNLFAKFELKVEVERIRSWHKGQFQRELPLAKSTYRDKLKYLFELSGNNWSIAQGMMDHYRRICSIESFFGMTEFEEGILEKILAHRKSAEDMVQRANMFVIPDLGYTFARTIHHDAIRQGKKVFLLNPHGVFKGLHITNSKILQNESAKSLQNEIHGILEGDSFQTMEESSKYIERRFSGSAKRDYESRLAFANSRNFSNGLDHRKILFLHCFRDTIRFFPPEDVFDDEVGEFCDYIEWTNWAFSQIAKEPRNWWIKPHPNSHQYSDENAIIQRLLELHNLPTSMLLQNVSVSRIIKLKLPIFTHSGTVILESAAAGNKSFSMDSDQFPASLTNLLNRENASDFYRMPLEKLTEFQTMSAKEINEAQIALFIMSKEYRPLFEFMANNPHKQHPRRSVSALREIRAFSELKKSLKVHQKSHLLGNLIQELFQFSSGNSVQ
jgi:hypothetical protein